MRMKRILLFSVRHDLVSDIVLLSQLFRGSSNTAVFICTAPVRNDYPIFNTFKLYVVLSTRRTATMMIIIIIIGWNQFRPFALSYNTLGLKLPSRIFRMKNTRLKAVIENVPSHLKLFKSSPVCTPVIENTPPFLPPQHVPADQFPLACHR